MFVAYIFSSYPVGTPSLIRSTLKDPLPRCHSTDHFFLNTYLSPSHRIPCGLIPSVTEEPAYY